MDASSKVAIAATALFSLASLGLVVTALGARPSGKGQRRSRRSGGKRVKTWKRVGVVDKLVIHALKSAQPQPVAEAFLDQMWLRSGGLRDHSFMIVDSGSGRYLNSRSNPRIILIRIERRGEGDGRYVLKELNNSVEEVEFKADDRRKGMAVNKLWDLEIKGVSDCGDEAAEWVSHFVLGTPSGARLMYHEE